MSMVTWRVKCSSKVVEASMMRMPPTLVMIAGCQTVAVEATASMPAHVSRSEPEESFGGQWLGPFIGRVPLSFVTHRDKSLAAVHASASWLQSAGLPVGYPFSVVQCLSPPAGLPQGKIFNEAGTTAREAFPDMQLVDGCKDAAQLRRALLFAVGGWEAAGRQAEELHAALAGFQQLEEVGTCLGSIVGRLQLAMHDVRGWAGRAARLVEGSSACGAPQLLSPSADAGPESSDPPITITCERIQGRSWLRQTHGASYACEETIQIFRFDIKVRPAALARQMCYACRGEACTAGACAACAKGSRPAFELAGNRPAFPCR
jgi:hypothetical protein